MSEQRKWILGILAAFIFGIAGGAVGAVGVVAFLHHRGGPPPFMAGGPGLPAPAARVAPVTWARAANAVRRWSASSSATWT